MGLRPEMLKMNLLRPILARFCARGQKCLKWTFWGLFWPVSGPEGRNAQNELSEAYSGQVQGLRPEMLTLHVKVQTDCVLDVFGGGVRKHGWFDLHTWSFLKPSRVRLMPSRALIYTQKHVNIRKNTYKLHNWGFLKPSRALIYT